MLKKNLYSLLALILLAAALFAGLLFAPKDTHSQRLRVERGSGIGSVSRTLAANDAIYSRWVFVAAAYLTGTHKQLLPGNYRLQPRASSWQILRHLKNGRPDTITVRIIEGMRFAQMRRLINQTADIRHDTASWSDRQLLAAIASDADIQHPEGRFFPDSYEIDYDSSDLQIYRLAYRRMQSQLQSAWSDRADNLPYKNPYELLTMASIIEKETAHEEDRANVAAVFVNRLNQGMRLQTDPTVIYGMGSAYNGRIRRADLQRDTTYNTYTRDGLPPTPIALPGEAALQAAAHPSGADYLYFVSRMDNTGKSEFSRTLDEHNANVRRYILKRP
ncbi:MULTISPECIES: endolytic transglycosylase MltG [unclassified Eikenella]|uniref:endolytic transglycosylase MltG n=1 Tax=unclassified Eikenella TaxID=2639367 RepID=UPI0007DE6D93|nr:MULTISPECIES: endolytic transglycosylase MltG [unclassified Eikenella]OAM29025.1 aminodeoxychorismate lyase [Eikenella sp. NML01-A-086]OAM41422.1 aminodeoxychorismate lyase [Eikenella sp. NML97-A-109]